jgi:hypothetical protein
MPSAGHVMSNAGRKPAAPKHQASIPEPGKVPFKHLSIVCWRMSRRSFAVSVVMFHL